MKKNLNCNTYSILTLFIYKNESVRRNEINSLFIYEQMVLSILGVLSIKVLPQEFPQFPKCSITR